MNTLVQFNEVSGTQLHGTDGQGFDVDMGSTNTRVQYNYSHDNEGGFLLLMGGYSSDVVVRDNLSVNDAWGGQKGVITFSWGVPAPVRIYNNTIVIPSGSPAKPIYCDGDAGACAPSTPGQWWFTNNIVDNRGTGEYTYLVSPLLLGALAFASAGTTGDAGRAFAVAAPAGLIALLVGGALGAIIGALTRFADDRGWTEPQSMRIAFIATPLIVFAAAVLLHGNGFVAVFVAGVAIRLTRGDKGIDRAELSLLEDVSWVTNLLLWLAFGFAAVVLLSETYNWWPAIVLALVALTIGRIVPVGLALIGSEATRSERIFVAVMGPRGAASIVFGLIAANALPGEEGFLVLAATCMVVLGSIAIHGVGGPLLIRRLWGESAGTLDGAAAQTTRPGAREDPAPRVPTR